MKIKDLPWFNRPGFKLTRKGVTSLDDAELLSIVFGVGSKGESALELANRLLNKYNLNKLENLSVKELAKECKWNYNKAMQILSLIEICKRYNKLINNGFTKDINSAKDVFNMFVDDLRNKKKEYLHMLPLDSKNRISGKQELVSIGTLDQALVHPREVFKEAIKNSASRIILVHNHPSGDCLPSKYDEEITKSLIDAGKIIGINIIDHIIISNKDYYSFNDEGKI